MSVKGEKYKSKSMMKRHEKMEGAKEMMMEYGKKKVVKKVAKKAAKKKVI
jgi:hypothetical protein